LVDEEASINSQTNGASKRMLIKQFLSEGYLTAFLSMIIAAIT
jgi:hypothetical protein